MLYYYYHCHVLVVCIRAKDDGKAARLFVVAKFVDIYPFYYLLQYIYS